MLIISKSFRLVKKKQQKSCPFLETYKNRAVSSQKDCAAFAYVNECVVDDVVPPLYKYFALPELCLWDGQYSTASYITGMWRFDVWGSVKYRKI